MTAILVESTGVRGQNWRLYHTRVPLISYSIHGFVRYGHDHCLDFGESGIAELLLEQVPGVEVVHVHRYRIELRKAELFTWDEIDPVVTEILQSFVNT